MEDNLKHTHNYTKVISQTPADYYGDYEITVKCKCGKSYEFFCNLYDNLDTIEAQDHEDACGDR